MNKLLRLSYITRCFKTEHINPKEKKMFVKKKNVGGGGGGEGKAQSKINHASKCVV